MTKCFKTNAIRSLYRHCSYLFKVVDLLGEDAVLVADAVSVAGHGEGGHAVQEAGRQSAQAPVTQASVSLHLLHLFHVEAELNKNIIIIIILHPPIIKDPERPYP